MSKKAVRFEIEYDDGEISTLHGDDAAEHLARINGVLGYVQGRNPDSLNHWRDLPWVISRAPDQHDERLIDAAIARVQDGERTRKLPLSTAQMIAGVTVDDVVEAERASAAGEPVDLCLRGESEEPHRGESEE